MRGLVASHESLTSDERRLIDEVFAAGERSVSEVMLPRRDVVFLDASLTREPGDQDRVRGAALALSRSSVRARTTCSGFVHIRDLVLSDAADRGKTVGTLVRDIKRLPGSKNVLSALSEMRREQHHMAIVVDEYGGTDGIVTLEDLIEEVIGDIRDEYDDGRPDTRRLAGGAIEVEGRINLDELAELVGVQLPDGPYETVGGYLMAELGRLPKVGDRIEYEGYQLSVTSVDGHRAALVRVAPPAAEIAGD